MQDKLISITTAKLVLEVGSNVGPSIFNWEVEHLDNNKVKIIELDLIIDLKDFKKDLKLPTQSLLQKWLREKHNIHIEVSYCFTNDKYMVIVHSKINQRIEIELDLLSKKPEEYLKYKSYEQALEIGLYEALKLIKNEHK